VCFYRVHIHRSIILIFEIVNVSELVKWKKNDVMAIKDTDIDGGDDSDTLDDGQYERGHLF
jgi:hypothetical protein